MRRTFAVLLLFVAGCFYDSASPQDIVREQASEDLRCSSVSVEYVGVAGATPCGVTHEPCASGHGSTYAASGCGVVRLYRCDTRRTRTGTTTTCRPASQTHGM